MADTHLAHKSKVSLVLFSRVSTFCPRTRFSVSRLSTVHVGHRLMENADIHRFDRIRCALFLFVVYFDYTLWYKYNTPCQDSPHFLSRTNFILIIAYFIQTFIEHKFIFFFAMIYSDIKMNVAFTLNL